MVVSRSKQLTSLILLRGIAAFMVCLCHFGGALTTEGVGNFSIFEFFHDYGLYGVHVFFVISGFVIPLSLFRGKYRPSDYLTFLKKRFYRLHPPYLAALSFSLLLGYAALSIRGIPFPEDALSIFKSIFYLHSPSFNPVFWTLRVEAEYYLLIGVLYIFYLKHPKTSVILGLPALILFSLIESSSFKLLEYLPIFSVGIISFLLYTNGWGKLYCTGMLAVTLFFISLYFPLPVVILIVLTLLAFLFFNRPLYFPFSYLGKISYSLYLIHYPIGVKFINLTKVYFTHENYWVLLIITIILCVVSAAVFYSLFEKFSENWSRNLSYG